jgi:hypothetical protein
VKVEKLNRQIFENTIHTMKKYGSLEFFQSYSQGVIKKRNSIKDTLLKYYESTEEFEKCKFVVDFFWEIEDSIENEKQNMKKI